MLIALGKLEWHFQIFHLLYVDSSFFSLVTYCQIFFLDGDMLTPHTFIYRWQVDSSYFDLLLAVSFFLNIWHVDKFCLLLAHLMLIAYSIQWTRGVSTAPAFALWYADNSCVSLRLCWNAIFLPTLLLHVLIFRFFVMSLYFFVRSEQTCQISFKWNVAFVRQANTWPSTFWDRCI